MINDYKKIVITLKKRIKFLQQEQADLSRFGNATIYSDTRIAMQQLSKKSKCLGLTPEMLFRAADVESLEIVSKNKLEEILSTVTKLHNSHIVELLNIFDMDKCNSITKDEYYQTLEMYGINEENSSNFTRNSFAKFIHFVKKEGYEGELGFIKMDPNNKGYITYEILKAFVQSLNQWQDKITNREILATFLFIDIMNKGKITKEEYLKGFSKVPPIPQQFQSTQYEVIKKILLIKKMKLSSFILQLIFTLNQPENGITYDIFYQFAMQYLSNQEILQLFKVMDIRQKGSIDYDELMSFYYKSMGIGDRFDIVFAILAKKLQAMNISIETYLKSEQVYEDSQFTLDEFHYIAKDLFNVQDLDTSINLFTALDLDNSGIVTAKEIIKYTLDALNQFNITILKEDQQILNIIDPFSIIDEINNDNINNLDPLQKMLFELKQYKTELNENDYFEKHSFILTNETACLIKCLEISIQNQIWKDTEFGPTNEDPYGSASLYKCQNIPVPGWPMPNDFEWKRINEVEPQWKFMDELGANANDVVQSQYLGNCWFLSALSIIASNDSYLFDQNNLSNGLYPKIFHPFSKYGIFVIKFNKMHKWIYVIIDDRFCYYNGQLFFGQCRNTQEWWVQIIEKAYAKLHYCYESLSKGDISQGLQDLTGIVSTRLIIDDNLDQLLKTNQYDLMGCSKKGIGEILIKGQTTGLYKGHAYSIIHQFQINDEIDQFQLLMLRNPWGFGEWKLAWSDKSQEIKEYYTLIENYFDKEIERCNKINKEPPERYQIVDDGIFLMELKDFKNIFDHIYCTLNIQDWFVFRIYDNFKEEYVGSPTKNPITQIQYVNQNAQYIIQVNHSQSKKRMFIQLQNKDNRYKRMQKYPFPEQPKIILNLFQIKGQDICLQKYESSQIFATSKLLSNRRDIDTGIIEITDGYYALIPSTQFPNQIGSFVISIYIDFPSNGLIIQSRTDQQFMLQSKTYNSLITENKIRKLYQQL